MELTFNEPVIVWFPLNEFEPVVANELLQIFNEDVNVFNCNIDEVTEPVTKYLKSNEPVNCDEPLTVPAGDTPPTLPLAAYLISNDEVNCDDPLIKPEGNGWTLPLNVYLISNEEVSWELPLIVPVGIVLELILFILLFTEELNATTSPIPKTEPDSEPVIEPLEST